MYYYYSFLGEHLILADLVRWRWITPQRQSGLHRQHSPHHERLFLSARRVDRRSCPKPHQTQNIKHYYLKTDGPSGLLQDFVICCKRVYMCKVDRRVATTNDDENISRQKTTKKGCQKMICIPETKREEWINLFCI